MQDLRPAALEFLARGHRIAVAGVSHDRPIPANWIYRKLRDNGYATFAVNPAADVVEGDRSYHSLADIEGGVDGVVIGAPAAAALAIVQDCARLGIRRVWMHHGHGEGSVSPEAVAYCEQNGIAVIPGACPMMYLAPDPVHRCMCWVLGKLGKLPEPVGFAAIEV